MKQKMKILENSIITKRTFPFSVQMVWRMWSEKQLIEQWWGPDGFTTTSDLFDFVEEGRWIFVMHGPDGTKFPNEAIFKTITLFKYIHFIHLANPQFTVYVDFKETSFDCTELTFTQEFDSKEQRDSIAVYAEPANSQIMEKLDHLLRKNG